MWTIVELAPDYWVILWSNDGGSIFGSDAYASLDDAVRRIADWFAGH